MPELGRFARELRGRFWKPSVEDEVRSEMAYHLELLEQELVARGVPPAEARAAARARFGDAARLGAECERLGERRDRERRLARWWGELAHDARYALRQLRANPRFTAVAVVTLAVGLGASTTIFGVADAVLLRPLPFAEPERLVLVNERNPSAMTFSVSEPNFLDFRERVGAFASLAAMTGRSPALGGDAPEQLRAAAVSANFFATLGRPPALGRAFADAEDRVGGDRRVVVLGHALWQRRFGGDRRVLDSAVVLDGVAHRVVGVAPPGFDFPDRADVWLPLAADAGADRGDHALDLVGRLAPDRTLAQAQAELAAVAADLASRFPESNGGWTTEARPLDAWYVTPQLEARVLALLATVALLLVLACVNVASLLLARAGARERELAVRAALGAGRGRIVRQLLTESLVLSLAGGAAGVALAVAAAPLVRATGSAAVPRLADLAVDWRVLGFALAACLATGLLFGLAPAARLLRRGTGAHALLRDGARVADGGRLRATMITASVAIATLLLVCAGLVGTSFLRLVRADLGFAPGQVLTAAISLPDARYDEPHLAAIFHNRLQARLEAIPGVRAAGAVNLAPLTPGNTGMGWEPTARATGRPDEFGFAGWRAVTPGYLASVGIPLRAGRNFTADDRHPAPRVVIINEAMARQGWPGGDPVGEQITIGNGWTLTVVGVVGDTRHLTLEQTGEAAMFFPHGHLPWRTMWLTVRTDGDPMAVAPAVRDAVAELDPQLPLAQLQPLSRVVHDAAAAPRLTTLVFAIFAGAALVLAAVGLYGIVSYTVVRRTRELGVRLALGALPSRLVALVLGEGLRLTVAGLLLGGLAAAAAARVLRGLLYDTSPLDARTYAAVALLLVAVTILACVGPARRAARLDPVAALRAE